MDPLHPITPIPPNIPPITPAPMVGRVDRDAPRGGASQDQRRRRRAPADAGTGTPDYDEFDYAVDEADGEDDSGLHINVTA